MVNSSAQWLRNAKRCRSFIVQVSYISRLLSQSLVQRYLCEHDQRQIYEARNIILGMQYVVAASGPWAPSAKTSIHLIGAHWLIQRNGTVASDFWDDKSTSLLVRSCSCFIWIHSARITHGIQLHNSISATCRDPLFCWSKVLQECAEAECDSIFDTKARIVCDILRLLPGGCLTYW